MSHPETAHPQVVRANEYKDSQVDAATADKARIEQGATPVPLIEDTPSSQLAGRVTLQYSCCDTSLAIPIVHCFDDGSATHVANSRLAVMMLVFYCWCFIVCVSLLVFHCTFEVVVECSKLLVAAADFFEYAPPDGGIQFGYDYT